MAHIKTYLRVKPTRRRYEDFDCTNDKFYIRVPEQFREQSLISLRSKSSGTMNQEFQFKQVFDSEAEQKEVYDCVAKDIVQGFLNGYNGTIFAYGQTGTGKTYTMEGGNRRYEDRGLAPRALSMVYAELEAFPDDEITVHVSFLEIYQEVGYDLLNMAARTNSVVTHFPKVAVVEGPKGSCVIRNLATHLAANEEVAQSLLLQGLANRKVAETSMNLRSSRSHAVFTIMLSRKKPNSDVITRSKLHLVDLAGSERVAKSRIDGMQLTEAKYINLSLHYLEGVIIALQQEACGMRPRLPSPNLALYNRWVNSLRPSSAEGYRHSNTSKHIPYRNSLLTMVLRDSLGGNCQTAMIATVTLEEEHLYETLSTCRFAQRVACITNTLKKNEEIDDKSMIRRLRRRIAELETELAMLKSGQGGPVIEGQPSETVNDDDLPLEDSDPDCFKIVQGYLSGKIRDPIMAGVNNAPRFRECFRILKKMILEHYVKSVAHGHDLKEMAAGRKDQSSEKTVTSSDNARTTTVDLKPSMSYKPLKSEQPKEPTRELQRSKTYHFERPLPYPKLFKYKRPVVMVKPNSAPVLKSGQSSQPSMRPGTTLVTSGRNLPSGQQTSPAKPAYKSPYERRRESDIKKLNAKVEKVRGDQEDQKRHLMEFQQSVQEQQLQLLRSEVKKKMESCNQQYTDQQAYIMALKQSHAETDLISQEQLIEKQIRKRKHKMEKRLQLLDSQIEKLKPNSTAKAAPSSDPADKENAVDKPPSGKMSPNQSHQLPNTPKKTPNVLEQKFPAAVNKDGKLNSRQVLEMLQKQEKQQEKVQENLEKNRVFTLTKQIEVKEAATRLKLQEFRERLRQSRADPGPNQGPKLAFGIDSEGDAPLEPKLQIPQYRTDSNVIVNVGKVEDIESNITSDSVQSAPNSRISSGAVQRDPNPGVPFSRAFRKGFAAPPSVDTGSSNYANSQQKPAEKWNNAYNITPRPLDTPSARSDIFAGINIKPTLQSSPIPDLDYEDLPTINCSEILVSTGRASGYDDVPNVEPTEPSFSWQSFSISDSLKNNVDDREQFSIDNSNVFISKPAEGASLEKQLPDNKKEPLFQPFSNSRIHHDPFASSDEYRRVLKELQRERDKDKVPVFKRSVTFGSLSRDIQRPLRTRITADDNMPQISEESRPVINPSEFSSSGPKTESDYRPVGMTNKNFEDALSRMLGGEGEKPQLTFSHEHYDKFARRPKQGAHTGKMTLKTKATPVKSSPQVSSSPSPKSTPEKKPLAAYVSKSAGVHRVASSSISERLDRLLEMDPFRNYDEGKSLEESDMTPYRTPHVVHDGIATPPTKSSTKPQPKLDLDVDNFTPRIKALKETEREEAFTRSVKEQKDRVSRIRKARKAAEVIQDAWRKYSQRQGVNQGQVKIKYVHYKS